MSESTIVAIVVASIGAISAIIVAIIQKPKQLPKEKSKQPDRILLVKPLPSKKRLSSFAITLYVIAAGLLGFIIFLLLNSSSDTLPPPSGYIILDQFDNQEPIENNWEVSGKTGNCSANKQDGYLYMECSESKKGSYWLEYVSHKDNMRQLSGGTLSGIAMSTKMIGQNQDTKVKVHFVMRFSSADGKTDSRAYFMDMRSNDIRIAESYPLEGWRDGGSILIPIDSTVFHIIQVEYQSNQLRFFIDGQPVELNFQPALPNGFTWQDWYFGVGIDNSEDQPVKVESLIDWIAVTTGQSQ